MRTISLCASLLAVAITAIGSAEPLFEQVDVFTAGTEGYHTFPIPAIVTVADGSLIALAEGRKENRRDPGGGDIDLVYKRSTDRGATWSALNVLDDPGEKWACLESHAGRGPGQGLDLDPLQPLGTQFRHKGI